MSHHHHEPQCVGLHPPIRNRYFYGKLLDVYHVDMEQKYFNEKRWLLNRLITGYGVICGLDVKPAKDGTGFVVLPGLALDKWGREIIVGEPSICVSLPPSPLPPATPEQTAEKSRGCDPDDSAWVHVRLCYHECLTDPVPALADDCSTEQRCTPGAIRERHKICVKEGKAPKIHLECSIPDLVCGDRLDYGVLARHISMPCRACTDDPCITLANIRLPSEGSRLSEADVDITVRPIVYTNDLLFEIIVGLLRDEEGTPRGGKPD